MRVYVDAVVAGIHKGLLDGGKVGELVVGTVLGEPVLEEGAVVVLLEVGVASLVVVLSVVVAESRYNWRVGEVLLKSLGDLFLSFLKQLIVAPCIRVCRIEWDSVGYQVSRDDDGIELVSLFLKHLKFA